LQSLKAECGDASASHATCALLVREPASMAAGEITDNGYVNQRAVLTRRAALVENLYATSCERVIRLTPPPLSCERSREISDP